MDADIFIEQGMDLTLSHSGNDDALPTQLSS